VGKKTKLRKKLTPDYKVSCKRLILRRALYNSRQVPKVTLETEKIKRFTKIDSYWRNKVQNYCSIFLPDYPSFFLILRPNKPNHVDFWRLHQLVSRYRWRLSYLALLLERMVKRDERA